MTSPTPQDPWLLPVAPHPDQVPGGKRRIRPLPVVLVSLLALAVLCCGGATLVTVFGPGKAKPVDATGSAPASVAPARQQIAAVPATSSPASPSSGTPRAATVTVKPSRKPTTPAPTKSPTKSPTTRPPAPKPTTPKPKPTTPKPAPSTARPPDQIVHAGAFCSPAGATGVTSKGKAMVCRSTATDSRNRWRAA